MAAVIEVLDSIVIIMMSTVQTPAGTGLVGDRFRQNKAFFG